MIVASIAIATARPNPNCTRPIRLPSMKPENAATMIAAAAVTILPVRMSPSATARSVSPVSSYSSRMRESRNTS